MHGSLKMFRVKVTDMIWRLLMQMHVCRKGRMGDLGSSHSIWNLNPHQEVSED